MWPFEPGSFPTLTPQNDLKINSLLTNFSTYHSIQLSLQFPQHIVRPFDRPGTPHLSGLRGEALPHDGAHPQPRNRDPPGDVRPHHRSVGQRRAATNSHETGPGNRAGGGAVSAVDDTGPGGTGGGSACAGVFAITGQVLFKDVPVFSCPVNRRAKNTGLFVCS